ncbi:hypothetical protein AC623_14440 [Bacillus sp. FJAT-27231]|uniref:hypothetical protein n=1 Tax=Bacillus sp. FJAT-27231 TaxID=1679168 RepID=UPI000670C30C|nr:hypothetical protein [Bacillus sp. FJAT-27231]KMY54983.1 hypothetical protein AC623_14440 [Bacillus sp. FJAT-27231]
MKKERNDWDEYPLMHIAQPLMYIAQPLIRIPQPSMQQYYRTNTSDETLIEPGNDSVEETAAPKGESQFRSENVKSAEVESKKERSTNNVSRELNYQAEESRVSKKCTKKRKKAKYWSLSQIEAPLGSLTSLTMNKESSSASSKHTALDKKAGEQTDAVFCQGSAEMTSVIERVTNEERKEQEKMSVEPVDVSEAGGLIEEENHSGANLSPIPSIQENKEDSIKEQGEENILSVKENEERSELSTAAAGEDIEMTSLNDDIQGEVSGEEIILAIDNESCLECTLPVSLDESFPKEVVTTNLNDENQEEESGVLPDSLTSVTEKEEMLTNADSNSKDKAVQEGREKGLSAYGVPSLEENRRGAEQTESLNKNENEPIAFLQESNQSGLTDELLETIKEIRQRTNIQSLVSEKRVNPSIEPTREDKKATEEQHCACKPLKRYSEIRREVRSADFRENSPVEKLIFLTTLPKELRHVIVELKTVKKYYIGKIHLFNEEKNIVLLMSTNTLKIYEIDVDDILDIRVISL